MGHEGIRSQITWDQHRQSPDLVNRQILHTAMKHIDDHLHDVNQALSWSSTCTVLPSISSPESPPSSTTTASEHNNCFRATSLPSNIASEQSCFWAISLPSTSLLKKAISLIPINSPEHEVLYLIPYQVKMRKCWVMLNMPPRSRATQDSCVPGYHCYHGCNGMMR